MIESVLDDTYVALKVNPMQVNEFVIMRSTIPLAFNLVAIDKKGHWLYTCCTDVSFETAVKDQKQLTQDLFDGLI